MLEPASDRVTIRSATLGTYLVFELSIRSTIDGQPEGGVGLFKTATRPGDRSGLWRFEPYQ